MRKSGILMHITSLPGPYGLGTMGKAAYDFVDFLAAAGQSLWQILPLTPTGYGDSPYQSCSAFAGNEYLIDLPTLQQEGLLEPGEPEGFSWGQDPGRADFGLLYQSRRKVLALAYARFRPDGDYEAFCRENAHWLGDYALYMTLKDQFQGLPWYRWEEPLKHREPEALYQALHEEYEGILAPFLAAIEMIHSSSLVHDDLPCMDNDRLRRGKPSTWAKYGEDMGTLAGDGLMIYAFETACKAKSSGQAEGQAERVLKAIRILAQKTGIFGMIGGQTVDVALTGKPITPEELEFIYRLKTGALLEASMMIGGVLAGAGTDTVRSLELAASELGMAFQIQDDILDETGSEEDLGKPVGSDERNCKTTYVKLYGLTAAEEAVRSCTERAEKELLAIGEYPFLMELCGYLIQRKH